MDITLSTSPIFEEVYFGTDLYTVFVNLIKNAIQAMSEGGHLEVIGFHQDDHLEIHFKDNGPGIPDEIQEKIFEFNYSDSNPSTPGKLGFCLWWVKTLMNRLGGFINVESNKEFGSVFKIKLPKVKGTL